MKPETKAKWKKIWKWIEPFVQTLLQGWAKRKADPSRRKP